MKSVRALVAGGLALVLSVPRVAPAAAVAQSGPAPGSLHQVFDQLLDVDVRDGLVYYRAVQSERARLGRYLASLDLPTGTLQSWSREEQIAFWINAYNAFVIDTVVSNYPIRGKSADYPANSLRQVVGAFERLKHRVAGKLLALDEIEKNELASFNDPRVFLALGRGALGGGRLRSEAFTGARLGEQLEAVSAECVRRAACVSIDRATDVVSISPVFSWREEAFSASYAPRAPAAYGARSLIERAIVAFVLPYALPLEKDMLALNTFRVAYRTFDWRLNDLSGGPPQ